MSSACGYKTMIQRCAHVKPDRCECYTRLGGAQVGSSGGVYGSTESSATVSADSRLRRADYVTRGRDEADHGRTGSAAPVLYTLRPAVARLLETR